MKPETIFSETTHRNFRQVPYFRGSTTRLADILNLNLLSIRLARLNLERTAKQFEHHLVADFRQRGIIPPLTKLVANEGI